MSLFACEERKTSFSDGNAKSLSNNTNPNFAHMSNWSACFIWSKQVLLPTLKKKKKKSYKNIIIRTSLCPTATVSKPASLVQSDVM